MNGTLESFRYDDATTRKFLVATWVWGLVGMLVGLVVAVELAFPALNLSRYIAFGRLRPLHTNAVIFAFAGNAIFTGIYYSTQRLLKTRMYSDLLSALHFWGWQLIIVAAAITLPLGFTQSKEYAELEWPIDLAVVVVWVVFAVNFFMTIKRRRERHLYVAIWFYIASIVTVAILYIFNNLSVAVGPLKSYSIYAGVQDALMQWWYGHNAVAFFLTTPFLGLMYYFLPKAANRPVFSYRLSILHFWSLVFMYIWAGPHHLHYTALPEWASTLGMIFSVMLWMPSWGGGVNGLLTLRGAWNKVVEDPILKFFVVAVTAYMMATFEGPMLAVKGVNALAHYTDWVIAHVHTGTLGWNGFLTFGMLYWLAPRLFRAKLHSVKLAELHFWLATFGLILYALSIYSAGVAQGLMWRAFDQTGRLEFPDFIETTMKLIPMYWVRALGGAFYILGVIVCGYNLLRTWQARPAKLEDPVVQAPPLVRDGDTSGKAVWAGFTPRGHRRWEALPVLFTVWTALAVIIASLFEIIPTFLIRTNVPTIASVKPWTPLELVGRDIYQREGCFNCHSQMIRPLRYETERFGEYSKPGEFVYDHPFLWGSRRIGPDLGREGGKYPDLWHVRHMQDPKSITPKSIMPPYPQLLVDRIDFEGIQSHVDGLAMLGVPYGDIVTQKRAGALAREQAKKIADGIAAEGGPAGLEDREITAVVAYLQRLGTDIRKSGGVARAAAGPGGR